MSDPHDVEGRRLAHRQRTAEGALRLHGIALLYRGLFATEQGSKVLADLRRCYGGSTTSATTRGTEARSAMRDVLVRIEDLLEIASMNPDEAIRGLAKAPRHTQALLNPWSEI